MHSDAVPVCMMAPQCYRASIVTQVPIASSLTFSLPVHG